MVATMAYQHQFSANEQTLVRAPLLIVDNVANAAQVELLQVARTLRDVAKKLVTAHRKQG